MTLNDNAPRSHGNRTTKVTTITKSKRIFDFVSFVVQTVLVSFVVLLGSGICAAQDHTGPEPTTTAPANQQPPATSQWVWHLDGNVFIGFNAQDRKFRNFTAWESQNWFMADAQRGVGRGSLRLSSMFSLEPFTLHDIGSSQVFQTGETFRGAPLIDYQHPHDLFMGLGAQYERLAGPVSVAGGIHAVGSPALGPVAFMHRPSAAENPQAPLAHHYTDSTHITPGVITGGLGFGEWRLEASWFHGREPDEDRTDIDLGRLDSGTMRLSWTHGGWSAQASGAYLTQPELTTPYDAKRLTASFGYTSTGPRPRVAWLGLFGQKREIHGNLEAYLLEGTLRPTGADALYLRLESVAKDILDAGFHPRGVFHRHRQSLVGAITAGYTRDLAETRAGPLGVGADLTGYIVPANLREPYGSPLSFHIFVRQRLSKAPTAAHVHP